MVFPVCAQDNLVAVIDELQGKEQDSGDLAANGYTFKAPGVLPIESTVVYSAKVDDGTSKLSPGLRLAGVQGLQFASRPDQIPELLSATQFGLALSNKLRLTTGGLKLSGEWTKVDADFDLKATADKGIKSLGRGMMRLGYGAEYEFGNGLSMSRSFSRDTNQKPGGKLGEVTESTKTGFAFAPDGGKTSLSFLIDETTVDQARKGRAGGRQAMAADFAHAWGPGDNANLSLHYGQLEEWGNTNGKKAEKFPTLSLEFTRHATPAGARLDRVAHGGKESDEKKGDDKSDPPVRTQFSHTVTETVKGSTGAELPGDIRETVTSLDHNFSWGGEAAKLHFLQRQKDKFGPAGKPQKKAIPTLELGFDRRGGADDRTWTSIKHLVTEKPTGSTGAGNPGDLGKTLTALQQGFSFQGRAAKFSLSREESVKWAKAGDPSETVVNNAHLDLPLTPALSVAADHKTTAKGSAPKVTQRTVRLTPVGESRLKGSWLEFQTLDQGGESSWDQTRLTLHSQTVKLPLESTLQGEFTKIGRGGFGAHDQSKLQLAATSNPIEPLKINATYVSDDHSGNGHKVETKLNAAYDINDAMSLQFARNSSQHNGEMSKQRTALTLKADPGKEGGLAIQASHIRAEQKGKEIDPETALQLTYDLDSGAQARALYKHRASGTNEYGAQMAFDLGPVKTTASYIANGYDKARKKQDMGNTFDLHCDWEIKKGLQLTTGLRTSSAARIFAGGIGPRLQLKGQLSQHEELMVGYAPAGAALKGKNSYMDFAAGAHDIKKNIKGAADASYILRYTKIVDADNLLVAYFRTGAVRMDNGMDKASGNPFADKSAWLEYRTSF